MTRVSRFESSSVSKREILCRGNIFSVLFLCLVLSIFWCVVLRCVAFLFLILFRFVLFRKICLLFSCFLDSYELEMSVTNLFCFFVFLEKKKILLTSITPAFPLFLNRYKSHVSHYPKKSIHTLPFLLLFLYSLSPTSNHEILSLSSPSDFTKKFLKSPLETMARGWPFEWGSSSVSRRGY